MNNDEYNGWKNYETWNVSLWIGNDESLYQIAKECRDYRRFKEYMEGLSEDTKDSIAFRTPDGVAWNDSGLDIDELDAMIEEL